MLCPLWTGVCQTGQDPGNCWAGLTDVPAFGQSCVHLALPVRPWENLGSPSLPVSSSTHGAKGDSWSFPEAGMRALHVGLLMLSSHWESLEREKEIQKHWCLPQAQYRETVSYPLAFHSSWWPVSYPWSPGCFFSLRNRWKKLRKYKVTQWVRLDEKTGRGCCDQL